LYGAPPRSTDRKDTVPPATTTDERRTTTNDNQRRATTTDDDGDDGNDDERRRTTSDGRRRRRWRRRRRRRRTTTTAATTTTTDRTTGDDDAISLAPRRHSVDNAPRSPFPRRLLAQDVRESNAWNHIARSRSRSGPPVKAINITFQLQGGKLLHRVSYCFW
jgi:hypothetical protein